MRVLIDTTYAERAPLSGTAIYLERLIAALAKHPDLEILTTANTRRNPPAGGGAGSVRNFAEDLRWTHSSLPREAARVKAELIHHPLPAVSLAPGLPQVITVHDLAFERCPEAFDRRFRLYARIAHRLAARRADAVVAVSETTAADLGELWRVAPEKIVVAHHGLGQSLPRVPQTRGRHLLYVGDDEPRKDLPTLLAAYARYRDSAAQPLELVLAGPAGPPGAGATSPAPGVRHEHDPTPRRLSELYAGAIALVHPARYEGFGMTLAEAMALAVPIIAARSPAAEEVCGPAAHYVWPGNPVELAAALTRITTDPALRNRLSGRGRERASGFSWARSAARHRDAYSLALKTIRQ